MTGRLSTHALDTHLGRGAAGLRVAAVRVSPDPGPVADLRLDDNGRAILSEALARGVYELSFDVAGYHRTLGVALAEPPFLDQVAIRFGVAEAAGHYHVPLLFTPYSYSTYRGG